MADRLGDPTPRQHDRLTLNPMVLFKAHPFGALIVPIIGALQGFLIGWAATPVNPRLVRKGISLRQAEFLISFAGPASNIILAVVCGVLWAGLIRLPGGGAAGMEPLVYLVQMLVFANVFLALLNLMPIPPLDGFTVLESLAPNSPVIPFIRSYSLIILVLVFMYAGYLFRPVMNFTAAILRTLAP